VKSQIPSRFTFAPGLSVRSEMSINMGIPPRTQKRELLYHFSKVMSTLKMPLR
jgi:hypothetical protein